MNFPLLSNPFTFSPGVNGSWSSYFNGDNVVPRLSLYHRREDGSEWGEHLVFGPEHLKCTEDELLAIVKENYDLSELTGLTDYTEPIEEIIDDIHKRIHRELNDPTNP